MLATRNVFLVGPMGVGKTTIGRLLARELRLTFVDSDQEIESGQVLRLPGFLMKRVKLGFGKEKRGFLRTSASKADC